MPLSPSEVRTQVYALLGINPTAEPAYIAAVSGTTDYNKMLDLREQYVAVAQEHSCRHCGNSYPEQLTMTIGPGRRYCFYCMVQCNNCNEFQVSAEHVIPSWSEVLTAPRVIDVPKCRNCSLQCAICLQHSRRVRARNGAFGTPADMVEIAGYVYCSLHLGNCRSCGELVAPDDLYRMRDAWQRLGMNEVARRRAAEALRNDRGNGPVCAGCTVRETGAILPYTHKPAPRFLGDGSTSAQKNLYIGIEHEMHVPSSKQVSESIKWVYKHDPDRIFYCKSDGSMPHGFEMVSHPMTIEWFKEKYPFSNITELSEKKLAYVDDATGIHIHVSRDAWTPYHLYRMLHMHYNYPEMIDVVARRRSDAMANLRVSGMSSLQQQVQVAKLQATSPGGNGYHNRYVAVNLNNKATLELRYFNSTVNPDHLKMYVEWIEAMYHFTRQGRVRGNTRIQITDENFLKWVDNHDYPLLQQQLRGYKPVGPVAEQKRLQPAKLGVKWARLKQKRAELGREGLSYREIVTREGGGPAKAKKKNPRAVLEEAVRRAAVVNAERGVLEYGLAYGAEPGPAIRWQWVDAAGNIQDAANAANVVRDR